MADHSGKTLSEAEDVFASSWPSGGQKQVTFVETDVGGDGGSLEIIRCNSSFDAVACVQPGWLHLFRSKEERQSWPMEEAVVEVAVSKSRIATMLQDGQLVVWQCTAQGQLVEEGRILFPETTSMAWCPDEQHMLCFGRHVESFLFLVEGLKQGSCLDCMGADVRHFSCEVKSPDSSFITCAAFGDNFFATASESSLSLWRWAAVPLAPPCVSLVSWVHLTPDSEVSKLCFAPSGAGEVLLVLCAEELRIFAFNDPESVLAPKRILCFGATSVADVTSTGLLVAKGKSLAYVSLADEFSFHGMLPQPVAQLALGPGVCERVLVRRGSGPGRCSFLAFEPVLTKEMARCLRQSYLKYWERSMAQLLRSCGKQVAGSLKTMASPTETSPSAEALQKLVREVHGLQAQIQAARLNVDSPLRDGQPSGLGQALESLLPQVVEKLGERLADPKDGQLFHERFLAAFPVQEEASLDELRRELHGLSQQLRDLLQAQFSDKLLQCCEQRRPHIWQCGQILTDALDEAVVRSLNNFSSGEPKQAVQRLHRSARRTLSTEELRQAVREALGAAVREAQEAVAPVPSHTPQLLGLRQCALSLQDSLEQLASEVKETQRSLRRLAVSDAQRVKTEVNGTGISS